MKQFCSSRTILLTIIAFLIYPALVFSSAAPISDLKIPAQFGNIKEVFEPDSSLISNNLTVIQIQDAHCNYEAQKNMAQILEYLITTKNLKLITVEGGSGDVSLSFLRDYADKKTREEVADKYLRQGKISGEEYLNIVSDLQMELFGVEDQQLYDANLNAFLNEDNYRTQGLEDIQGLKQITEQLEAFIYNPQLKDFEAKKSDYQNKSLGLAEYCKYLKETADAKSIDLKDAVHFSTFVESARLEKELDFKQVEIQRNTFIKELAGALEESQVKDLIAKTQDFKAQKINSQEYYTYLEDTAKSRIDLAAGYPQLASYISYIKEGKNINVADLIKEINGLEDRIREALFTSNDEKELSRIAKGLDVLDGFLKLDLTPQEYEVFSKDYTAYKTASWINFLSDNCRKFNISLRPQASQAIDDNLEKLEDFYKLGLAREQAFIANLENKLKNSGEKIAVLIAGGFHTPGVTRMLREKGYSYAVVAPVITEKSDSSLYFSVLRDQVKNQGTGDIDTDSND